MGTDRGTEYRDPPTSHDGGSWPVQQRRAQMNALMDEDDLLSKSRARRGTTSDMAWTPCGNHQEMQTTLQAGRGAREAILTSAASCFLPRVMLPRGCRNGAKDPGFGCSLRHENARGWSLRGSVCFARCSLVRGSEDLPGCPDRPISSSRHVRDSRVQISFRVRTYVLCARSTMRSFSAGTVGAAYRRCRWRRMARCRASSLSFPDRAAFARLNATSCPLADISPGRRANARAGDRARESCHRAIIVRLSVGQPSPTLIGFQ